MDSIPILTKQIIEDYLRDDNNQKRLQDFLEGSDEIKDGNTSDPVLQIVYGDKEKIKDKAVWFLRVQSPESKVKMDLINNATQHDGNIIWGEITSNTIPQLNTLMEWIYDKAILFYGTHESDQSRPDPKFWGLCEQESIQEFFSHTTKFTDEVNEAIKLMAPEKNLFVLDKEELNNLSTKSDHDKQQFFVLTFSNWIKKIQDQLREDNSDTKSYKQNEGPNTELDYWRTQMQKITNFSEQLKSKDFVWVKMNIQKNRSSENKRSGDDAIHKLLMDYSRLDLNLTDKLNEAKDNVKYLTTLEKFIEPLYKGTPQQIIDTLPALMNAINMIHTIARFYNTSDKMTGLFMKITNQMIINCRQRIESIESGKGYGKKNDIWSMDPEKLIQVLSQCINLYKEYKENYNNTKEKVTDMPKGKTFDFADIQIFGKFDAFVRRLQKLMDIFSNIQQFRALQKHNLEDMGKVTGEFYKIIEDFKKKNHDLLDTTNSKFDRDFVEFNVSISNLDQELQKFIDENFQKFRNIEYSLKLLKKFETTIKRDSLRHNLTNKYNAILHNYATDLDAIQRIFQDNRNNPPIVRNMPTDAGKIIWARHLFQKITGPITLFPENRMTHADIRRYYGSYNNLGRQLTIYEMWYFQNWVNEIERSKAALQATLIVRHDENKKLYVNFDLEIMQLIREAKVLDRQPIEIPESARIILLQEEKFKMYYNELLYALKEYERILSKIKPICKTLLQPHIEDLELKLRPGMVTLTWTSMNIDSYLLHVHQGLKKLEQLIINVNDIIENRIENNLKSVSKVILVQLPQDTKPLNLQDFVELQESFIDSKTAYLISKNIEVERSVDDLLDTINQYPLDPHVNPVENEETKRIKRYYFWYFYQALLNATQNSLNAMKYRVCGKKNSGSQSLQNLKPFFVVDIQLNGNIVQLNPTLEDIQKSINKAATAVLRCSKNLYNWDQSEKEDGNKATFYDMIAQDKEIVKVILLLTGSIQGTKNKVNDFLSGFKDFLWLCDPISDKIKAFKKDNPSLQDYEDVLKKFQNVEEEIDKKETTYKIGAMELQTQNICHGFKRLAQDWKQQYAQSLHVESKNKLDDLTEQTKKFHQSLKQELKSIKDLGNVMGTLEDIRKKQAQIDMEFNPVQEAYVLLDKYLQDGMIDKDEQDARSMLWNNWNDLIRHSEEKGKALQVKQGESLKSLKHEIKSFTSQVIEFRAQYDEKGPMVKDITPQEAMERLHAFGDNLQIKLTFQDIITRGEKLFGLQVSKYPSLEKTKSEIKNLKQLYDLYEQVINYLKEFKEKNWQDITRDQIRDFEEQIEKYKIQSSKLPKDLQEWQAYKDLKKLINDLTDQIPLIQDLKKPSIVIRHWQEVCRITNTKLKYDSPDQMTIEDLLNANLLDYKDDITDITEAADKQKKIKEQLDEITGRWQDMEFEFIKWGPYEKPCKLQGLKVQEIQEILEEDTMNLGTINAQRHVTPFKAEVEEKIRIFSDMGETLDLWVKVQLLWSNLQPVFTAGDIAKQMPLQAKQFRGIDKNWIKIMEKASDQKKVIGCCQNDMLKDFLPDLNRKLEDCQKMLENYLEGKRKLFPRFYFVSGPNLLKILSSGSNPRQVSADLEKLFDAITDVEFGSGPKQEGGKRAQKTKGELYIEKIFQMMGTAKEEVTLIEAIKCEGNIEVWLKNLEIMMQETIKDLSRAGCKATQVPNLDFFRQYVLDSKSQIALMGLQVLWTQKVEEALEKISIRNDKAGCEKKKEEIKKMSSILSELCLSNDINTRIQRTKVETLVTIQVHQYDVSKELKCKITDFEWQKQTRMYWKNDQDQNIISITDWDCKNSYEFLGSKERLCITPLTDRCYITLAQAMSMHYGGAPAGPAGTGKTETVKDLGRTLGVFVVVTNCSDQHRYKDMAKIFKGLVQSGLWGCFDEFNRIDLEVLSVVAMQVESITAARKGHQTKFMFPEEEFEIDLVPTVSYFITMNPGYAGRQELPENLKVLFRNVSMMVPDRQIIIKVKLASVGYETIDPLSIKFTILYKLCEEQLSKQRHYDFGLRNILSVLRTAGNTKRQDMQEQAGQGINFIEREEMLLMRSLRDMNLSKLVADDIPLFGYLLQDIFPKQTSVPKMQYPDIENMVPQVMKEKSGHEWKGCFIQTPEFQLKIIQLYETQKVRHGFMMVGPTGTGKTTIMNILTESMTKLNNKTVIVKMNPKAIKAEEMYGIKSEISDDWIQGVFSALWKKFNDRSKPQNTWITCDGPVDAIWIENLNTVLDDNRILTLANGDRIMMTDNCKMVFEVENLNNASPATVSRCGQVYVSPSDMDYRLILRGYCQYRGIDKSKDEEAKVLNAFNKFLLNEKKNVIEKMILHAQTPKMNLEKIIQAQNICNIVTGQLKIFELEGKVASEKEVEKMVLFAIVWGIGGVYDTEDRKKMQQYLLDIDADIPSKFNNEIETVFDQYVNTSGQWVQFKGSSWVPPPVKKGQTQVDFSSILMPTLESARVQYVLDLVLKYQTRSAICSCASLLIGESGTAKTSSVLMYANTFDPSKLLFKRTNFSSATQPSQFQATVEAECDFKAGRDFTPPNGKNMSIFIDDIAMPFMNKWGDQITLEIVRQLIEQQGFYMLDPQSRGNFKSIIKVNYIGAMQHPGGGRNDIPNRLKRQFLPFNLILPSDIKPIYDPILQLQFSYNPKVKLSDATTKVISGLTTATVNLWNMVKSTLLPTPSKFHYVFNMRDLSRIFKGILQIQKEIIIKCEKSQCACKPDLFIVALWKHECERVFVDKLINNKDKQAVVQFIQEICIQTEEFSSLETDIQERLFSEKPFLFLNFIQPDEINEDGILEYEAPKVYDGICDFDDLRKRCNKLLDLYNQQGGIKKMLLVLFDDALKHLLRISRIIIQPRSSFLVVGVGGSGKQSLSRLASYINKNTIFQLTVTRNYGEKDLKEDIKKTFEWAGHLNKQVTFIMTDAEVKKEEFLEYINVVLSTGEIPGLLAKDEKETWLGDIQTEWQKQNKTAPEPTQQQMYNIFVERVKDNIHMGLCFSPVGQKFRDRARKFPALFNECTIDWFLPWPEEALVAVADIYIKNFEKLQTTNEIKSNLTKHMGNVHLMVSTVCDIYFQKMRRQNYVTPKSYLSYLTAYKELYSEKYDELNEQGYSYKIGLDKIDDSSKKVEIMGSELQEKQKVLNDKTEDVNKMLVELDKKKRDGEIKRQGCQQMERDCNKQASEINAAKEEAERDLQAALPALKAAVDAVNSLKPADINNMKANKKPIDFLKLIFDPVAIFFQAPLVAIQPMQFETSRKQYDFFKPSWTQEASIKILGDSNFLSNLRNFEKDNINDETIELLDPYMNQQQLWFNEQSVASGYSAAVAIFKWAVAIRDYHLKSKIVKPKTIYLEQQKGKLEVALKKLSESKQALAEVEDNLAKLQKTYDGEMETKTDLENDATKTKKRIHTARNLISSLKGEKDRWDEGLKSINEDKRRLVGNSSLSTAFVSYCGPFNSEFRSLLKDEYFIADMRKRGVPLKPDLDLIQFLVSEAEVGEWGIQGLPKDDLSVQNGIMVKKSKRYCLLVDPQIQGQNWIMKKENDHMDPQRSKGNLNNPRFKDSFLKFCMENGNTLIIENIENEVDSLIDPVLEQQIQVKGKTQFIDVGGTSIDFHKDFKLYLFCRLANPLFSPELSAKVTIIDFTVTQGGLEQQLLGKVISKEQKQLEDSLTNLLLDINLNKKSLMELDKNLLDRLIGSRTNLLDDTKLMEVLNNTKTQAKEVEQKLKDADVQTKEISEKREYYRPVAIRGSALYFTMIEVSLVNWMYNSSLDQFLELFNNSIDRAERVNNSAQRVKNIEKKLTFETYRYVNRGLFEKDKVSFILMICFKKLITGQKLNTQDISIFLKSGAALDLRQEKQKPNFNWLSDESWLNICALSKHNFGQDTSPFFRDLPDSISRNTNDCWKIWIEKNDPENFSIPDFSEKINQEKEVGSFIQMCVIRALRKDRTKISSSKFIDDQLGPDFVKPLSYPISSIYDESSSYDPILYLLSAGADPTAAIDDLAKRKKKYPTEKVSMGEGQEVVARKAMYSAFEQGTWVVLQNCHLGLRFMNEIETLVNKDEDQKAADEGLPRKIHEEFRLWITCEQNPNFPLGLLQKTLKVTNEPPIGIKAGLNKTFTTMITQEFIDKIDSLQWRNLLFTTCFLHSVVVERKKFGPLGWCIPYEFNYSDLEASLLFIEKYLSNQQLQTNQQQVNVNMKVIQYMICEVQYGGRITDDLDRELFGAYGEFYFKETIFQNEHSFVEVNTGDTGGIHQASKFKYKIPDHKQVVEIQKYQEFVGSILDNDSPEVFGLHPNADLTFRLKESNELITTVMETRPKDSSSGGGKTREEFVFDYAKELSVTLPQDYFDFEVRELVKKLKGPAGLGADQKGLSVPLNIFLYQEIQRMQRVISIVRKSFKDAMLAIEGTIIMTPDILDAINCIYDAKVPDAWLYDPSGAEISWLLPSLGSWYNSLQLRNKQLNDWLNNGRPPTFCLAYFFNPQGFLTAMKQEVTRMHKNPTGGQEAWSLDDVIYTSTVKEKDYESIRDKPTEGVLIHGLFLEGCGFSKTSGLEESKPKQIFTPLPILHVTAVNKAKGKGGEGRDSGVYDCPVYKYLRRNDKYLIFRVKLPCEGTNGDKWKMRGVALLCSTE